MSVVKAGEVSGRLQEVLNYLADHEERSYDLNKKVKGALIYPIFIVSSLVVVGAVMMIFVIPQLTAVLVESGQELPFITKLIIGLSNFMINYWWLALLMVGGLIGGSWYTLQTKSGQDYWDKIKITPTYFWRYF